MENVRKVSRAATRKPPGPPHVYIAPYREASRCATCRLHILEIDALAGNGDSDERRMDVTAPRGSRSIHHASCVAGTEYAAAVAEEGGLELLFTSPCVCGEPLDLGYLTPHDRVAAHHAQGDVCVLAAPRETPRGCVRMFHRACVDALLDRAGGGAEVPSSLYTFVLSRIRAVPDQSQPLARVLFGAHSVGEPHSSEGDLPVGVVFLDADLSLQYKSAVQAHPALEKHRRRGVLVVPQHEAAWFEREGASVLNVPAAAAAAGPLARPRETVSGHLLIGLDDATLRASTNVPIPQSVELCGYVRLTTTSASCAVVYVPGAGDIVPVFWR